MYKAIKKDIVIYKMPDYSKGTIYMLEPTIEYEEGDIYYGSTTQPLYKRFYGHKKDFKYNNGVKSKVLFEKYGIENIKIILIKSYSCENKKELEAEEAKYIRENKCVNMCIPGRSKKEYDKVNREQNKQKMSEYDKKYYENNKEKIKENAKNYYENNMHKKKEYDKEYRKINIEKKKEYDKKYNENNKQKRAEYFKLYREANKEKLKEKIKCECGCEVVKTRLKEHQKRKKHNKLMNELKFL